MVSTATQPHCRSGCGGEVERVRRKSVCTCVCVRVRRRRRRKNLRNICISSASSEWAEPRFLAHLWTSSSSPNISSCFRLQPLKTPSPPVKHNPVLLSWFSEPQTQTWRMEGRDTTSGWRSAALRLRMSEEAALRPEVLPSSWAHKPPPVFDQVPTSCLDLSTSLTSCCFPVRRKHAVCPETVYFRRAAGAAFTCRQSYLKPTGGGRCREQPGCSLTCSAPLWQG